jgi:nanoRNase/pAp phosphatase (c-di-AMP/oligoRNAs hydrolase)
LRYLAICDDELPPELTSGSAGKEPVAFLCDDPRLRKRIHRRGFKAFSGDLEAPRTYRRVGVNSDTFFLVSLRNESKLRRVLGTLQKLCPESPVLVLERAEEHLDGERLRSDFPDMEVHSLHEAFSSALEREIKRASTRKFVHTYRQDFKEAERVLILLHDEPDPDSLASGLALRAVLARTRQTSVLGTFGQMTRPENVKMAQLLDLQVRHIGLEDLAGFQRIAVVDTQPHIFEGQVPSVDLVVDHHPVRKGYEARFADIRAEYGATATIFAEHLQAAGGSISERLATAMLYAIKSDTLFLDKGRTSAADVQAFSTLYPMANLAVIRKIEGAGTSLDQLGVLRKGIKLHKYRRGLFYTHLGKVEREDFIPYMAEFFLELQETQWTAVSGIHGENLVLSVRNLGYQRSAGEMLQRLFGEEGSAGGHRAAAKAVIPLKYAVKKAQGTSEEKIRGWLWKLLSAKV